MGIIEVMSFRSPAKTKEAVIQAAAYAKSIGLTSVTLALFVPVEDEIILNKLSDHLINLPPPFYRHPFHSQYPIAVA